MEQLHAAQMQLSKTNNTLRRYCGCNQCQTFIFHLWKSLREEKEQSNLIEMQLKMKTGEVGYSHSHTVQKNGWNTNFDLMWCRCCYWFFFRILSKKLNNHLPVFTKHCLPRIWLCTFPPLKFTQNLRAHWWQFNSSIVSTYREN